MKVKDLSIIVFAHNLGARGPKRLRNFLCSLRSQRNTKLVPDIFVMDQSNDNSFDEVDGYCKKFRATHVYSYLEKLPWNKPACLNTGIKMTDSTFVGCADVDNIFAPNYLSVVERQVENNKFLVCRVWLTRPKENLDLFDMKEYNSILNRSKLLVVGSKAAVFGACGACQIASRNWFIENKGYNEHFTMWGSMDNEMILAAKFAGLIVQQLCGQTSILHQYHKKQKHKNNKEWSKLARLQFHLNGGSYKESRRTKVIERKDAWGNLSISSINNYRN